MQIKHFSNKNDNIEANEYSATNDIIWQYWLFKRMQTALQLIPIYDRPTSVGNSDTCVHNLGLICLPLGLLPCTQTAANIQSLMDEGC